MVTTCIRGVSWLWAPVGRRGAPGAQGRSRLTRSQDRAGAAGGTFWGFGRREASSSCTNTWGISSTLLVPFIGKWTCSSIDIIVTSTTSAFHEIEIQFHNDVHFYFCPNSDYYFIIIYFICFCAGTLDGFRTPCAGRVCGETPLLTGTHYLS